MLRPRSLYRLPIRCIRLGEARHGGEPGWSLTVNVEQARHAVSVQPPLELCSIGVEESFESEFGWETRYFANCTGSNHAVVKCLGARRQSSNTWRLVRCCRRSKSLQFARCN